MKFPICFKLLIFSVKPHLEIVRPFLFSFFSNLKKNISRNTSMSLVAKLLNSISLFINTVRLHLVIVYPLRLTIIFYSFFCRSILIIY